MKTNLDGLFKTNSAFEKEGINLEVAPGVSFRVRRFGGSNAMRVSQALAKYHKPYAQKMAAGSLDIETINLVDAKVLSEACIVGWQGIVDENGQEVPFSFENSVDLLTKMPDLLRTILNHSQNFESFKEDVGNS